MANVMLLRVDRIDDATITTNSQVSTLPAANALTPRLSQVWRSNMLTAAYLQLDFGASVAVRVVALLGTNLTIVSTWRIRLSDNADMSSPEYDSGSSEALTQADVSVRQAIHILPTPATARYLRINMTDTSLAYLQVGRVVAGAVIQPTYNYAHGWRWVPTDLSTRAQADDGTGYVNRRRTLRGAEFSFPALTDTEARGDFYDLAMSTGTSGNALAILDPASTHLARDTVWGLLEEAPAISFDKPATRSTAFRITERA